MPDIKKVVLTKVVNGEVYNTYPKTSADIVEYGESSVSDTLDTLASALEDIIKDDGTIDAKVKAESEALYNKLMGIVDEDTTVNEAFDTLKEVADYLADHDDVVSGFTTDISALQELVGTAGSDAVGEEGEEGYIPAVESSGLMKKIGAMEAIVGDGTSGVVKDVEDLKKAIQDLGGDVEGVHTPQVYTFTGDTTDVNTAVAADKFTGVVFGDGDIMVITDENGVKAAYQFDADNEVAWEALDGNVSADNIIMKDDITLAGSYTSVGNVNKGSTTATSTLSAKGKSLTSVLQSIFTKELQPTATQPAVSFTSCTNGAYEVGTEVTPSYVAKLSAGSYTYGPATGITASSWEVTDTNGGSNTTASGSFDTFTVADDTNYKITAKATYDAGAKAVTNLGNETSVQIAAGSKSTTYSTAITGFRKAFYGSKVEAVDLTSENIRALTGSNSKTTTSFSVAVVEGATQVIVAVPSSMTLVSVADTGAFGTDIVASFVANEVVVAGADGAVESEFATTYNVYVYSPAAALSANTYDVVIE